MKREGRYVSQVGYHTQVGLWINKCLHALCAWRVVFGCLFVPAAAAALLLLECGERLWLLLSPSLQKVRNGSICHLQAHLERVSGCHRRGEDDAVEEGPLDSF